MELKLLCSRPFTKISEMITFVRLKVFLDIYCLINTRMRMPVNRLLNVAHYLAAAILSGLIVGGIANISNTEESFK